jgi:hypothetical protein
LTFNPNISLQYQQEDQMINISTEQGFADIVKSYIVKSLPLKIYIKTDNPRIEEPPSEQEINDMFQLLRDQGYVDNIKVNSRVEDDNSEDTIPSGFNHKIACQLCKKMIIGTRWTCTICPGVNLCTECETQHNKSHPLIRITEQLPSGTETVFSLCTGLSKLNEKIHQISVKEPIICASSAAHNAKAEISGVFNSISTQVTTGSKNLRQEMGGLVDEASKIIDQLPNKLKDIQTKFSEVMSSCGSTFEGIRDSMIFEDTTKVTRFASELRTLEEMGFSDQSKNEKLLKQFGGNVEVCLDVLLNLPLAQ